MQFEARENVYIEKKKNVKILRRSSNGNERQCFVRFKRPPSDFQFVRRKSLKKKTRVTDLQSITTDLIVRRRGWKSL